MGCTCRHRPPYRAVGPPVIVVWCRTCACTVVGCPTASLAPCRRHVVSDLSVVVVLALGLVVVVETRSRRRRTPALGYPRHCGLPFHGGRPIIVAWCRWSAHTVVGCHAVAFAHRRRRVVLDLRVLMGLAERRLEALATATGKVKGRQWATTKVVTRFRDVPGSHFPPPCSSLRVFLRRAQP